MPQDAYGNYVAGLDPLPTAAAGSGGVGTVRWGSGAPDAGLGNNGDLYVNLSTGDVYEKSGDTWAVVTGGGGGVNNLSGSGSPVGVETPDYVGQLYTDTDTPSNVWVSLGLTDTDWLMVAGNLT